MVSLCALTACTATPPPPPPPTPPPAPATACPPSGVTVAPGMEESASGLRVLTLELTNCGAETYELNGFPGIRVLNADGAVLAVEVGQGSSGISAVPAFDVPPAPVALAPDDVATTAIMWKNTTLDGPRLLGATVEVQPRPDAAWQALESKDDLHIDLGTTGELAVRPWTPA